MHSPSQCVEFHLSVLAVRVGEGDGVGEVISVENVIVVKSSVQVGVYCEGVCVCGGGGGGGRREGHHNYILSSRENPTLRITLPSGYILVDKLSMIGQRQRVYPVIIYLFFSLIPYTPPEGYRLPLAPATRL